MTPTHYDTGKVGRIVHIDKGENDYAFELEDGYRFSMLDVGYMSATFYAVDAGDTLGCKRDDYDRSMGD